MSNVIELIPNKGMSLEQLNQLATELNSNGYIVVNRSAVEILLEVMSRALSEGSTNGKDLALRIVLQNFTNLLSVQPLTK